MASVSKSFTVVADGPELLIRNGESATYAVTGTFDQTLLLQQFTRGGWVTLATVTTEETATVIINAGNKAYARVRLRCNAIAEEDEGTAVTTLTEVTSETSAVVRDSAGTAVLNVSEDGVAVPSGKTLTAAEAAIAHLASPGITTGLGCVMAIERTFTETAGAGVFTASVAVPAGATILDVIVSAVALWNSETSATLKVGEADDDGYYIDVDLKATDLLAGESLSFALAGGQAGAYIANSQVSPRYAAAARTVTGIITKVGDTGTAGRTRMLVVYALPVTADIVAATKV